MKYKVGDKVRIKSFDWYEKNKDADGDVRSETVSFLPEMISLCGQVVTIQAVVDNHYYYLEENDCILDYEFIEGLAEDVSETTDLIKATKELEKAAKAFEKAKEKLKQLL